MTSESATTDRSVASSWFEPVSLLAGISVEYYTKLERGNARGVSDEVLDGVSSALQLNDAERDHLLDLVRAANTERMPRRTAVPQRVRPSVQRLVDAMAGLLAFVRNGRLDILYANPLAAALYTEQFGDAVQPPNSARYPFLDPRARTFYVDWDKAAHDVVAQLRSEAGRKTPTTERCRTSSDCSPRGVTSSECAGRRTTSLSTGAAPSGSTTRWSGI